MLQLNRLPATGTFDSVAIFNCFISAAHNAGRIFFGQSQQEMRKDGEDWYRMYHIYIYKCTGVCMCKDSYLSRSICTYTIYIKKKCYCIFLYTSIACFFFVGGSAPHPMMPVAVESLGPWDPLPEIGVRKQANLSGWWLNQPI